MSCAQGGTPSPTGNLGQLIEGGLTRNVVALAGETLRPIRVVEAENRRLGKKVCATVAVRMIRITLDLGRAPIVRLHQQRNRAAPRRHGRGVELGRAMDVIIRELGEGINSLLRLAAAGTEQAHPRQSHRGGHELHEIPAIEVTAKLARALRELPVKPRPGLGRVLQLVDALPVLHRLGLRTLRRNRFHR
jgi:hypothetical protein